MSEVTRRRARWLAIGLLVGVVLGLLWIALHLWPTSTETAEGSMQPAHRVTSEQAHALRRGYYLYRTGHPRAAHKALKRGYRHYIDIPRWRHIIEIPGPFSRRGDCRTTEWSAITNAAVVDARLYSVTYVQRFCWERRGRKHVVTDVSRLHARQDISDFGEFLNWSAEGAVDSSHGWCVAHVCHISAKMVRFHQCTPSGLIGCIFPRDKDVWGWMYTYGDGQAKLDV